jgi:Ca2+-binding RTX toxin-like protein
MATTQPDYDNPLINFNITPVNPLGIEENIVAGTVVATLSSSNPFLEYALTGDDVALFGIVDNEIRLRQGAVIDFERNPVINLKVIATDRSLNISFDDTTEQKSISFNTINLQEAPELRITPIFVNGISEIINAGVVVAQLDLGDLTNTATYSLSGKDAELLEVVGNKIQIKAGAFIDFETNPTIDFKVEAVDSNLKIYTKDFSLNVADVNEIATEYKDTLYGSLANDTIDGRDGNDEIFGKDGDDNLYGGDGIDIIEGGNGNDIIYGGNDGDILLGNSGDDLIYGDAGNDSLDGQLGNDTLYGGAGNDSLTGSEGADILYGGDGNDFVYGGYQFGSDENGYFLDDNNFLSGGNGNDILYGNNGSDTIYGDSGKDILHGEEGADTLFGGLGLDQLSGGTGSDTFVFNTTLNARLNKDNISDFKHIDDSIELDNSIFSKLTLEGVLSADSFKANATGRATDKNDYILYNQKTGDLSYDSDGSGSKASVVFAHLDNKPLDLSFNDFIVI